MTQYSQIGIFVGNQNRRRFSPIWTIFENTALSGLCSVVQVEAGGEHTCALLDNKEVRCWGLGLDGRLGYGTVTDVGDDEMPFDVGSISIGGDVDEIACGQKHSCALLESGAVRCWGDNQYGQLGYGHSDDIGDDERPDAAGDVALGGVAVSIVAGNYHTCALLETGAVRCWGLGSFGRLGYGSPMGVGIVNTPADIGDVNLGEPVTQLAAGAQHTCAILQSGGLRCWGRGLYGRLGYATESTANVGDILVPADVPIVDVGADVVDVTAGFYHTCVITTLGTVLTGSGSLDIAAGDHHTCAVSTDHQLHCWGFGSKGQLGYGSSNNVGDNEHPNDAGEVPLIP